MPSPLGAQINQTTGSIITAAIKVHRALGPGLLESAYNVCLQYELADRADRSTRNGRCRLSMTV